MKHKILNKTCSVCGCEESKLTTDCCGYKLQPDQKNKIYRGIINYVNKQWTYKDEEFGSNGYGKAELKSLDKLINGDIITERMLLDIISLHKTGML